MEWLWCPRTPPPPPLPALDQRALHHPLSLTFRGWINFSGHLALLALQRDAAAILAHLLFPFRKTKKIILSFNFLSSAHKSLPVFLKWTMHRIPSGYTCGAFPQTCSARVPSALRPVSVDPGPNGRGTKNPQMYPPGEVHLCLILLVQTSSFIIV